MRTDILLAVHFHLSILNCSVLPLVSLFKRLLQSVCLRDAVVDTACMIAKDVVDFPLLDALDDPCLHGFILVTPFQHYLIFMLILGVQRNQSEIILVGQMPVKLENMRHSFVPIDNTIKLVVNNENDALLENVMMAQVLINGLAMLPSNYLRQERFVQPSPPLLPPLDFRLLGNNELDSLESVQSHSIVRPLTADGERTGVMSDGFVD